MIKKKKKNALKLQDWSWCREHSSLNLHILLFCCENECCFVFISHLMKSMLRPCTAPLIRDCDVVLLPHLPVSRPYMAGHSSRVVPAHSRPHPWAYPLSCRELSLPPPQPTDGTEPALPTGPVQVKPAVWTQRSGPTSWVPLASFRRPWCLSFLLCRRGRPHQGVLGKPWYHTRHQLRWLPLGCTMRCVLLLE